MTDLPAPSEAPLYVPRVPASPPLSRAVELIFSLSNYTPEHSIERLVPNGRINLVIELDGRDRYIYDEATGKPRQTCRGAWLSGVQSRYISIGDTRAGTRLAAVQFAPGAALPLLHRPLDVLGDRVVPAADWFGESIVALRARLLDCEDGEPINTEIESWLTDRYDASLEPPEIVREAVRQLLTEPGRLEWARFVEAFGGVSYRHFVKLFRKHVGTTPKSMQRILRFSSVFHRIHEQRTIDWATLSLELGYSDQAHFIRDFREFSGYRPQAFVDAGHDRINFFPDDAGPKDADPDGDG